MLRFTIALLAFALTLASADTTPSGPVPLWTPVPMTPIETAGSGEGPDVRARVHVDARGAVSSVEVLSIQPSGRYDYLFRAETVKTLGGWRFRPARENGVAVAREVPWTIRFLPFGPDASAEAGNVPALTFVAAPDVRAEEHRRRILALPDDQRLALQAQTATLAEAQLDAKARREASIPGVVVVTDIPGEKVPQQLANNVGAIYHFVYELFREHIDAQPAAGNLLVYVFRTKAQYQSLVNATHGYEWSAGFYAPSGLLAFHTEFPTTGSLVSVMIHEVTHALLDRHVVRPGVGIPRWLDEGFADYCGASDVKDGKLLPGSHKKRADLRFSVYDGAMIKLPTRSASNAATVKNALRKNEAFTLKELMSADVVQFYGARRELYYSQAYLAVHFLRHGRSSWGTGEFPRFVLYVAEGYSADAAFRTVYGASPESFEDEFKRYAKNFM